jgi:hypothetical protein
VVVLDEANFETRSFVSRGIEGFEKEAAIVVMDVGMDQQDITQLGRGDLQAWALLDLSMPCGTIHRRGSQRVFRIPHSESQS